MIDNSDNSHKNSQIDNNNNQNNNNNKNDGVDSENLILSMEQLFQMLGKSDSFRELFQQQIGYIEYLKQMIINNQHTEALTRVMKLLNLVLNKFYGEKQNHSFNEDENKQFNLNYTEEQQTNQKPDFFQQGQNNGILNMSQKNFFKANEFELSKGQFESFTHANNKLSIQSYKQSNNIIIMNQESQIKNYLSTTAQFSPRFELQRSYNNLIQERNGDMDENVNENILQNLNFDIQSDINNNQNNIIIDQLQQQQESRKIKQQGEKVQNNSNQKLKQSVPNQVQKPNKIYLKTSSAITPKSIMPCMRKTISNVNSRNQSCNNSNKTRSISPQNSLSKEKQKYRPTKQIPPSIEFVRKKAKVSQVQNNRPSYNPLTGNQINQ